MLSPENIKTLLVLMGVQSLTVEFNAEAKELIARFIFRGEFHEKIIPFSVIEKAFSNPSAEAPAASVSNDLQA